MEDITKRFFDVVQQLKLNASILSKEIPGMTEQKFSNAKNGRNALKLDVISYLCSTYERANSDYILTGRGKPLKEETLPAEKECIGEEIPNVPKSSGVTVATEEDYKQAIEDGLHLLPEVDFKFAAGQVTLLNGTQDITRYWYLPDCKDCEGVAQVVGNSMAPALPSGCWVALKKYTLPSNNPNKIPFGNIFGVVVEDDDTGEYHGHIKVLRRYKEPDLARKYWIAQSINSREFDDFDIEIAKVKSLWIVKQHIVSDILL